MQLQESLLNVKTLRVAIARIAEDIQGCHCKAGVSISTLGFIPPVLRSRVQIAVRRLLRFTIENEDAHDKHARHQQNKLLRANPANAGPTREARACELPAPTSKSGFGKILFANVAGTLLLQMLPEKRLPLQMLPGKLAVAGLTLLPALGWSP